jgi:uncharacterized repeat protein (TIGR02543 family)
LTVTASPAAGGEVALSPVGGTYAAGTVVTLTATANPGYAFSSWSGGAAGTTSPTTVTMTANKSVTANFPAGITFYNDSGLNINYGTPDILQWSGLGTLSPSEPGSGGAPGDTSKYQAMAFTFTAVGAYFGEGIGLITAGHAVTGSVNLLSYSSGNSMKFYIRLSRALAGAEDIKIEIEYTPTKATVLLVGVGGFDKTSTSWQAVSIPLTSFVGVDYTKILLPFEITPVSVASNLTVDWDYVRWAP